MFVNQKLSFQNVVDLQLMMPRRGILNENKMFMATIPASSDAGFEKPEILAMDNINDQIERAAIILTGANYSAYVNSTNTSSSKTNSSRRLQVTRIANPGQSKRVLQDASSSSQEAPFPADASFMAVPYLPYFTNCQFYGSFIFIPAIFENHPRCQLENLDTVKPVGAFSFGQQPTADTCKQIVLQCL